MLVFNNFEGSSSAGLLPMHQLRYTVEVISIDNNVDK
jgi:hypothetical protein